MASKDNFSKQANKYAIFRPVYPQALYDFIFSHCNAKVNAWDCATGNGQVARELSKFFENIYATDISQKQIDNAFKADNIKYTIAKAEKTTFDDNFFDLITVGQALHWFDFDDFHQEIKRIGKNGGIIAAWGYGFLNISNEIDEIISKFYYDKIGPYWDPERRFVEEKYESIPFPFENISSPAFEIKVEWTLNQLIGYLNTWSSVQKYIAAHGSNPVDEINGSLINAWGADEVKAVTFPLFVKIGKIIK